ncbi:hypothetical protein ACFU9O_25740 [Streptomyces albidoflavus]|uniref:Uncharacterized protein n=1 Tax=Streptomyces albidoflavus TaxID=1886 RepID=A0ABY3GXA5_9ACTN|nr:hypothetical protein [Streptomyces albidoflavus]MBO1282642.1 hypothetical protein [Streptomyces sampsonii]NUW09389.1 hypothetical protein [Streptomyces sp. CAI-21]NVI32144.1 hypothetical protein [Streptomyces sp. CAI-17]RZF07472.1 hypothetical protein C0R05_15990 [Streptomyces albidoflavus]TWV23204.1 hypothetical protein FRZ02_17785 [Streptomyces albidoflavus]
MTHEQQPAQASAAPEEATLCRPCQELALAEAVAKAEYDWSRATDCRVLMKRHRESGECVAGQSA